MFPRDGKPASSWEDIWEIGIKWSPLAGESVSTRHNKEFSVKTNLH